VDGVPAKARRLAGLTLLLAVTVLTMTGLAACGAASDVPAARPFGTPPSAAPGVRAWAAGEVGTLLVTGDGGASWKRQRFYLPARGLDVSFADARTGWLVTDGGAVLSTKDGGAAWHVADVSAWQIKALAATDAAHAWVVGAAGASTGDPGKAAVRRTSDGGETWTRTGFGDALLVDVAFADARHGVLVALDRIWTTRDGGAVWELRRRLAMTVLTSAHAGDARHAWVAGWRTQDGLPFVLATEDGGETWRRLAVDVPPPSPGALQPGGMAVAGDGTATAAAGQTRLWITCPAGVLASRDAGTTWELQQVPAGTPVAVAAADGEHLLATSDGQPVLATSDAGETWSAWGSGGFLSQPLVSLAAIPASADE
jgi:photosystem II stability/assembly factor-like uncharacterized protein